jgi:hypothetical protein
MANAKTARNKKNGNGNGSELTVNPSVQTLTETKKNVVPINLDEEIRRRAFEIFEERGCTPGNEHEDWVRAEREVLSRYEQTA